MVGITSALLIRVLPALVNAQQCILTAPTANLLSAPGLASVWTLSGTCTQADPNTRSFLEATIYEPKLQKIFAYSPLLITAGSQVLAKPVVPKISKHAVIVYHFGSNANTITLQDQTNGATLKNANCVNGLPGDVFGQFAYCNAQNFFPVAIKGVRKSNQVPPLGRSRDGRTCPTSRAFEIVDQDQSDNVVTSYLQINNNTVQNTAANRKKFGNAAVIINPSDEVLLANFIDPAIGCKPFVIPALDDLGTKRATLAGNEIQAALKQKPPVALVPLNDPMVLAGGTTPSLQKTNLYRLGVGQPPAKNLNDASGTTYCKRYGNIAPPVILRQGRFTSKFASLNPAVGNTLFTFLGVRFQAAWAILNCQNLTGKASPIIANVNGDGVAVSLTFIINGKTIGPTTNGIPPHRRHRHRHHHHHH
jgi:hypothetical protein